MIDKNPAAGRYVLLESSMTDCQVGSSGLITKVSKTRIYFTKFTNGRGESTRTDDKTEQYTYNFTYVADTPEEVVALQEYSWSCLERILALRRANAEGFEKLLTGTPDGQA